MPSGSCPPSPGALWLPQSCMPPAPKRVPPWGHTAYLRLHWALPPFILCRCPPLPLTLPQPCRNSNSCRTARRESHLNGPHTTSHCTTCTRLWGLCTTPHSNLISSQCPNGLGVYPVRKQLPPLAHRTPLRWVPTAQLYSGHWQVYLA